MRTYGDELLTLLFKKSSQRLEGTSKSPSESQHRNYYGWRGADHDDALRILPIARKLVRTTDRLFGITVSQNLLIVFWRVHVMPRLVALIPKEKHLIRFAFRLISQIGIHYRDSSLSGNASFGSFPRKAPRPGDRLPFLMFQEKDKFVNIQAKVKAPAFHLLLFPGTQKEEDANRVRRIIDEQGDVIQVETISLTPGTENLYRFLGVQTEATILFDPTCMCPIEAIDSTRIT